MATWPGVMVTDQSSSLADSGVRLFWTWSLQVPLSQVADELRELRDRLERPGERREALADRDRRGVGERGVGVVLAAGVRERLVVGQRTGAVGGDQGRASGRWRHRR